MDEPESEPNPYRPPNSDLGVSRDLGRYRPALTVARVLVALWGLFILAGPSRFAPNPATRQGMILAKGLGALLFLVAVFPFRKARKTTPGDRLDATEDL